MGFYEWYPENRKANGPFIVEHYNMGQVTGAPTVRARARMFYPATLTSGYYPDVRAWWGTWSNPVKAEITSLPIIEIASVIGIVGLAIGIANNYLSGQREKKTTDVTRTIAEDERFMELYNASREPEFQRTMAEVLYQYQWTDYNDFQSKYGPEVNVDAWAKVQSLAQYFEGIGVFVDEGSIDIGCPTRLIGNQSISTWDKLKDVIMGQRQRELNPSIYGSFERLYYAIKKYQQDGPPHQDDVRVHKFE